MKKFILFDFDGTLVDTQVLYDISASESLFKLNPKYTLDYCIEYFNGRGWKEVFYEIEKLEPKKNVKDALKEALTKAKKMTLENITTTPDAGNVLKNLKEQNFEMAICSNSSFETIFQHLRICHLSEFFEKEAIFALESVQNSKPAPDVYLEAMRYFDAKKEECLILEDSIAGLKAASFAEVDALFYKGGSHNAKNSQNSKNVVASLKSLENNTLKGEIEDLSEIFNYLK